MEKRDLEQFCEHVQQRNIDILAQDPEEFIYEYYPSFPCRPNGFLIWGKGNVTSVMVSGLEQLRADSIPIRALVNPYVSIVDAKASAAEGRLFCSNIHLPIIKLGDGLRIKTDCYCVIALCGIREKQ